MHKNSQNLLNPLQGFTPTICSEISPFTPLTINFSVNFQVSQTPQKSTLAHSYPSQEESSLFLVCQSTKGLGWENARVLEPYTSPKISRVYLEELITPNTTLHANTTLKMSRNVRATYPKNVHIVLTRSSQWGVSLQYGGVVWVYLPGGCMYRAWVCWGWQCCFGSYGCVVVRVK